MLNIFKADLYRITRGRGFYIAIVMFLTFIILQVLTVGAGTIGADTESMQHPEYWVETEQSDGSVILAYNPPPVEPTGKNIAFLLAPGMSNVIYFVLPFIVFIAVADFSKGAVKNLLASGISRWKYFLVKLISIALVCILVTLAYVILPIIVGTIKDGFGGKFDWTYIKDLSKVYLPQMYILFAYGCIGLFLSFTFKRTAVLNTGYIGFSLVPILVLMIIRGSYEELSDKLLQYDLTFVMQSFGYYNGAMPPNLTKAMLVGGFYILAGSIGGMLLFRKAEIK